MKIGRTEQNISTNLKKNSLFLFALEFLTIAFYGNQIESTPNDLIIWYF